MYKLILVDDEQEVRKGILQKIEWEKYGFEIIGEAENGREALDIAEKTIPDVVITDIKMPFMDGMQLSKVLRERFPTTKVIILTGFDEFEYAQKAIKLNVVEYALKPIASNELIEILIRVKLLIDEEKSKKEDINVLMEYYKESLPVLREKFLTTIITSKLPKEEIYQKSKVYNINLSGNCFIASIITLDYNNIEENLKYENTEIPDEKELLKFGVLNLSEEIVEKHSLGTVFLNNNYIVVISVWEESDREHIIGKTISVLEEIRQNVEKFMKCTVTIGIGTIVDEITSLKNSYESAVSANDYRLVLGNNRIIWIEDIEPQSANKIRFDEIKEHTLTSSLKVGTSEEITDVIDNLFTDIIDNKASFEDYQIYILEMITTILKVAKDSSVDMENIFGTNYNLFVELYKFNNIKEVKFWIKDICIRIVKYIVKDRQDTSKLLVEKAKNYVKSNYADSEITINKVCSFLHISPTYFSFIFKKEVKITFINYLTQIRMEAAKELLRATNMKALEVAEKVGYSESNYFSYSFKKNFGVSPSEYRNSFKV